MFLSLLTAPPELPRVCAFLETPYVAAAAEEWVTLGEIKAFGQTDPDSRKLPERKVAIRFPKGVLPPIGNDVPSVPYGNRRVLLNEWGNLGRIVQGDGGFDEVSQMYKAAQERIAKGGSSVWKCKAVLFKETTVFHTRVDGVLESQHAVMTDDDITFCLETYARFEALVEALTEGAVDMQLTFSIETEPVTGSYNGSDTWSLHPVDAGDNYVRGRFNRGDFDCILYMYHPATTDAFSFGGTQGRTNNATQAYIILSNGREGGARIGHTEAMLHEWFHQVQDTCSKWGYGGWEFSELPDLHGAEANGYTTDSVGHTGWFAWMRDLIGSNVTPGMWAKLSNRTEPDYAAVRQQTKRTDGKLHRWRDVKDDPWAKLPYVTPQDLASRIGASSVAVEEGSSQLLFAPTGLSARTPLLPKVVAEEVSVNNELNFGRESVARIGYRDRDLLFVRWDIADYVIEHLADHPAGTAPPANIVGYMSKGSKQVVVLDTKLSNDSYVELNLFNVGGVVALTKGEFAKGEDVKLTLAADVADARFAVTDFDGTAMTLNNGVVALSGKPGFHLVKATAALPSGERIERPIVFRVVEPLGLKLEAVGTTRVSTASAPLNLTLTNRGAAATVRLTAGTNITGLPNQVALAPWETKHIPLTMNAGSQSAGEFDVSVTAMVGQSSVVSTARLLRDTATDIATATFENGTDGWDTKRDDGGGWSVASVPGGAKGNALEIKDKGGMHWGRVNAFGGTPGYDLAAYPYLDFYLETTAKHNLGFVVTLSDGSRHVVMLAGPYMEQWGESKELPRAKFIPNGEWQRIVYDLNAAIAGSGRKVVVDIGFGDTRKFSSNQVFGADAATHYVDEFRIARNANVSDNTTANDPDDELKATASPTSENPDDRARAAAAVAASPSPEGLATIRPLLRDPEAVVRANAAAAFAKMADAESVPILIAALKLERDPLAGIMLVRAIEKQAAPQGLATFADIMSQGRFEELAVAEAALALGRTGDAKFVQNLAVGITGRSWLTRRDSVRALSMMQADTAQQTLMTFLLEVDPMVRIAVARAARVDVDPIGRRMEWGSINDLSDVVRGYSYAAQAKSTDAVRRSRGYAGLKEPSADIRRIIAEELQNDSKEHHVQPLLGLLSDPVPEVRAAALRALLKMPGKRDFSEMSPLSGEEYEEVLVPLLEAAKTKSLVIPQAMLGRLKGHRSHDVRKLAKEINP